jgi:hypothetical protein
MIFTDSRYADGTLIKAQDSRTNTYRLGVYRKFPTKSVQYYQYVWAEGDRIDSVTNNLMGNPSFWWQIMDANPEIINPTDIPVGTILRIPRV